MKSPFKFLDSYTRDDRKIFFGREREIEELYQKVFESKTMLVYGVSGTGKSSLIHCGLASKFSETDWLPLAVRRSENIVRSLAAAIKGASLTRLEEPAYTPQQFRKAVKSLYLDMYKPVFFIFDQFEELFISGSKEEKQEFALIVRNLTDSDIQCRFIFVMREEYMAGMTELEKYLPSIFRNRIRIEKMSHLNALEAIKGPCKVAGIGLEDGFAEALLEKLCPENADVELTYLQVFLDKIYRLATLEKAADSSEITFTSNLLEKSGDVSDLLGSFLDEQILLLDDPDTGLAVLKSFVSAKGTRSQMSRDEVADYARALGKTVTSDSLQELLQTFVNLRILKDRDQNEKYELRHDALASKIYDKITLVEKEIIEIRQLVENALERWHKRKVLMPKEDLDYIAPYESRLYLPKDYESLIARSKRELLKSRRRRRNIVAATGLATLLVLLGFTLWAVKERNKAVSIEKQTLAAIATNWANQLLEHDPTVSLGLADYALRTDPGNRDAKEKLLQIYYGNNFYKSIGSFLGVNYAVISPDGRSILVSYKNTVRLTDLDGKNIKIIAFVTPPSVLAFAPDGKTFLAATGNNALKLYDLAGNILGNFPGHRKGVSSLTFSPDGSMFLVSAGDTIMLWDVRGKCLLTKGQIKSGSVSFSPDGNSIISVGVNGKLSLFDLKGSKIENFGLENQPASAVAFSPDGRTIAAGMNDFTVKLCDRNGTVIKNTRKLDSEITELKYFPDGEHLFITCTAGLSWVYNTRNNTLQKFKRRGEAEKFLTWLPEKRILITYSRGWGIKKWLIQENQIRKIDYGKSGIVTFAYSPDRSKIVFSDMSDMSVATLWDLNNNKLAQFKGHEGFIASMAFSPDGTKLLTGGYDETPRLWDINGNLLTILRGHYMTNYTVAYSPDGKYLLTSSMDGTARLWDLTGKTLTVFKGHTSVLNQAGFSPDGTKVVTCSLDGTVKLWKLNGELLRSYQTPVEVTSASFSPDGLKVAGGLVNGTIILWDLNGNELKRFDAPGYRINKVLFSHDGKKILAMTPSQIREWDLNGRTTQIFTEHGQSQITDFEISENDVVTSCSYTYDNAITQWGRIMPVDSFILNSYSDQLSAWQKLDYNLISYEQAYSSKNPDDLLDAAQYYFNKYGKALEISEKMDYLSKMENILKKLIRSNKQINIAYKGMTRIKIEEILLTGNSYGSDIENYYSLLSGSDDPVDLEESAAFYRIIYKNFKDSVAMKHGFPTKTISLIIKMKSAASLPNSSIAEYLASYANELYLGGFYKESLEAVTAAVKYDSLNAQAVSLLPFVLLTNNQPDKAVGVILEWKDRKWSENGYFDTFGEAFRYTMRSIETRGIDEKILERIREILKYYPLRYVG